jgi:hypothetical protein
MGPIKLVEASPKQKPGERLPLLSPHTRCIQDLCLYLYYRNTIQPQPNYPVASCKNVRPFATFNDYFPISVSISLFTPMTTCSCNLQPKETEDFLIRANSPSEPRGNTIGDSEPAIANAMSCPCVSVAVAESCRIQGIAWRTGFPFELAQLPEISVGCSVREVSICHVQLCWIRGSDVGFES